MWAYNHERRWWNLVLVVLRFFLLYAGVLLACRFISLKTSTTGRVLLAVFASDNLFFRLPNFFRTVMVSISCIFGILNHGISPIFF